MRGWPLFPVGSVPVKTPPADTHSSEAVCTFGCVGEDTCVAQPYLTPTSQPIILYSITVDIPYVAFLKNTPPMYKYLSLESISPQKLSPPCLHSSATWATIQVKNRLILNLCVKKSQNSFVFRHSYVICLFHVFVCSTLAHPYESTNDPSVLPPTETNNL